MCTLALRVVPPHPPPPRPLLRVARYLAKVSFTSCKQQGGELRAGPAGYLEVTSAAYCFGTCPLPDSPFPESRVIRSLDLPFPSNWQALTISSPHGHKPEVSRKKVASSGKPTPLQQRGQNAGPLLSKHSTTEPRPPPRLLTQYFRRQLSHELVFLVCTMPLCVCACVDIL